MATEAAQSVETEVAAPASGLTARTFAVAFVCIIGTVLFIHWAELVLGGVRGHSALANTSIPVGAFFALVVVLASNALFARLFPAQALTRNELVMVYVLTAASTVIVSSGGIHFLVPTLTAPWYFATPENHWAEFQPYIPKWFSPRSDEVIKAYYDGQAAVPWASWAGPLVVWFGFVVVFSLATLSLVAIVRRQWVEHEKLTFPTVYIPLNMTRGRAFWRDRVLWIGLAIPFIVGSLNTLNLNVPTIPKLEYRSIDLSPYLRERPWDYLAPLSLSLYPFVTGIAYLLSTEVTFSSVAFFWFTKFERLLGGVTGWNEWGSGLPYSRFPFLEHQGAGAFIALGVISFWTGRGEYARLFRAALNLRKPGEVVSREDAWPVRAFLAAFVLLVLFCRAAGMSALPPIILLALSLLYMTTATRIRAETGNAWLFGPSVDPNQAILSVAGSRALQVNDLTIMSYLSNISSYDLRCIVMPHQLDGLKIAGETGESTRKTAASMLVAVSVALAWGFACALAIWYRFGALGKLDVWRTLSGRRPFERLEGYLANRTGTDWHGTAFMGVGGLLTVALMTLRMKFLWWPLHPVGYALAGTYTMDKVWMPFLIAYVVKSLTLRYGGPKLYQRLLPFFLGLVMGDLFNGGFWTLIGCLFSNWHVYPMNW
jgi:Family of unknown function (DUF6785)/Domain of unknown function (DUF6784)